ncbi:MAG: hypothetical protein E7632_06440 [Ruminococcaceae bacterium]|nr:hypothetical protein [Oscillospiraceae bacterium]
MNRTLEAIGYDFAAQWTLAAYALLIGAALGAVFDVLRISRVFLGISRTEGFLKKASDAVITVAAFFEDIAFFVTAALTVVLFVFQTNYGTSRGFILVGVILGFFLYLNTVGRLTKLAADAICRLIRHIISLLWRHLLHPMLRLAARCMGWLYKMTLMRVFAFIQRRIRRRITNRTARELTRFCASVDYQRKGSIDESGKTVHTCQARDLSRVRLHDRDPRERADSVQHLGGGTRKAGGADRRCADRHRRAEQQAEHALR